MDTENCVCAVALDIEGTGSNINDKTFAIGFAHVPLIPEVTDGSDREAFGRHLKKRLIVLDLGKPDGMPWEDYWAEEGFEMRTYSEMWSEHLDVLDKLQSEDWTVAVKTEKEFADAINDTLRLIEEEYTSTLLLSDTLTNDVPTVSELLTRHGHLPLRKTRRGGYQSGSEVDSYVMGTLGLPLTTSWSVFADIKKALLGTQLSYARVYDHDPSNDAAAILSDCISAHVYNAKK